MTSEIMKRIGSFTLYSMNGGIKVDGSGIHTIHNAYIPGTAIKLKVNHNILSSLKEPSSEVIKNLTAKGEAIAHNNSGIKTASKKSKEIY